MSDKGDNWFIKCFHYHLILKRKVHRPPLQQHTIVSFLSAQFSSVNEETLAARPNIKLEIMLKILKILEKLMRGNWELKRKNTSTKERSINRQTAQ